MLEHWWTVLKTVLAVVWMGGQTLGWGQLYAGPAAMWRALGYQTFAFRHAPACHPQRTTCRVNSDSWATSPSAHALRLSLELYRPLSNLVWRWQQHGSCCLTRQERQAGRQEQERRRDDLLFHAYLLSTLPRNKQNFLTFFSHARPP